MINKKNLVEGEIETPYYVFFADDFIINYFKLDNAMKNIYKEYQIAYSFKTNYTPGVCYIVKKLGGYAEVVSDMEYELALRIGFEPSKIIYNGPVKGKFLEHCLLNGGLLNIDNFTELDKICKIAESNPSKLFNVGIRVNFELNNGVHSRFGIDIENNDFYNALCKIKKYSNLNLNGIHFHISRARGLASWSRRIQGMLRLVEKYDLENLKYIDIGSGMYGDLDISLKKQFGDVPNYNQYADVVANQMNDFYREKSIRPMLITEPGTTLISKYFRLYLKVLDIKTIREKDFALLDGSFHNVGEICSLKKAPLNIINKRIGLNYENIDFVGYTCLEQDILYSGYNGMLSSGDIVEISNVGGYSIVNKPPFIHPDIPIYMILKGKVYCIKREQTIEDIFGPYEFKYMEGLI